jgi:hypothetical protein
MNNQRRAKIRKAERKLQKLIDQANIVTEFIDDIIFEEEEMFDNLPDWKQTAEHGIASEEASRDLQGAIDEIGYGVTNFEEAMNALKGVSAT